MVSRLPQGYSRQAEVKRCKGRQEKVHTHTHTRPCVCVCVRLASCGQMVQRLSVEANLQQRHLGNKTTKASRGYLNMEEEVSY